MTVCPGYGRLFKFEVLEEITLKENQTWFCKKKNLTSGQREK